MVISASRSFRQLNVSFIEAPNRQAPPPPLRPIFTLPINDVFNLISRNRPRQHNKTASNIAMAVFKAHYPIGLFLLLIRCLKQMWCKLIATRFAISTKNVFLLDPFYLQIMHKRMTLFFACIGRWNKRFLAINNGFSVRALETNFPLVQNWACHFYIKFIIVHSRCFITCPHQITF